MSISADAAAAEKSSRAGSWETARRLMMLVGLVLMTPGCATVYLHSASEQKAADDVKAGLDTAHTAHLAAIDSHRAYLESAITNERGLVVRRQLALRDQNLAAILSAPDRGKSASDLLGDDIGQTLEQLSGTSVDAATHRFTALGTVDVSNLASDAQQDIANLAAAREIRDIAIAAFEAAGGKGQYCDDQGAGSVTPVVPGTDPGSFDAITVMCKRMTGLAAGLAAQAVKAPGPFGAALINAGVAPTTLPGGTLKQALVTAQGLRSAVKVQSALARGATAHLAELQRYYQCEQHKGAAKSVTDEIAAAAKSIQDFIVWVNSLSEKSVADAVKSAVPLPAATPTHTCTGPDGKPVAAPQPIASANKLAGSGTQLSIDDAKSAVAALSQLRVGSSLVASVQGAVQDYRASTLGNVIQALADPAADKQKSREAIIAASFARLLGRAQKLDQVLSGKLPDTSGVLVQLAEAEMLAANANASTDQVSRMSRLADLRVRALQRQGLVLQQGNLTLTAAGPHAFDRALLRYARSWTEGAVPAAAIEADMRNSAYLAWIERERLVVDTSYAVLAPGVAEMQAHGAGGFTPSDIANYLQAIGLGAIAIH